MKIQRCQVEVLHRDAYRRTGRGSSGFEMHYQREQCSFKATNVVMKHSEKFHLCSRHFVLFNQRGQYWIIKCDWDMPWQARLKDGH